MGACSRHTLASDTHSGHTTETGTARPSGQGLTTRHKGHTSHSTGGAGTRRVGTGSQAHLGWVPVPSPPAHASSWCPEPHPRPGDKGKKTPGSSFLGRPGGGGARATWAGTKRFIGENCLRRDYSQPAVKDPMASPPKDTRIQHNKYNRPPASTRAPAGGPVAEAAG